MLDVGCLVWRDSVSVSEAVATKERQRGVSLALLLTADRSY
jgi:hypothetical protein